MKTVSYMIEYNNSKTWLTLPTNSLESAQKFIKTEIKWLKHARIIKVEKTIIESFTENDVK